MSITITSNLDQIAAKLEHKGKQISEAMTAKVDVLALALQRHIVADKLQGQILQQRRGNGTGLAGSIRVIRAAQEGNRIVASIAVEGVAEKYAAIQEFGTSTSYSIEAKSAKILHFLFRGKDVFTKRVLHPPLRKRSFLRSSLDDMKEDLISGMSDAVQQVLEAK